MWTISNDKTWSALKQQFEWIRDMEGIIQDPVFHAEGDVEVHTHLVVEALVDLPEYQELSILEQEILFAAALLHDVEKRSTTVVEKDGSVTSAGHARKGEYTSRTILYKEIETAFSIRESVAKLVRYHGLPLWALDKPNPEKAVIKASLEVNTHLLAILSKADVLGRVCPDVDDLLLKIELFIELCKEQQCYCNPKSFASDLGRYEYFQKEEASTDYEPYEKDKFEVVLMAGVPGSGKDTYITKHYKSWPTVSLDDIRRKHNIGPTDKRGNGKVIQMAMEEAKTYLRKRRSFIWNATNLFKDRRAKMIDLFQAYGAKTTVVYIEVPYKQLLHQNKNRQYVVPENVLNRMISRVEIPAVWEAPVVKTIVE